ncbi:MAG: hypothetical protein EA343_11075 [Nodularia sp. (in: Bacteria)]|nr:MAG: hypothetical protein EA343_11075 [Nodularia sp. (in: cyanobacteria)]
MRSVINKVGGFKDQVNIQETGVGLNVPVAILHGNEDTVIPKQDWVTPFNQFIATNHKKMYLSFTDQHGLEPMYANHEQATIDTSFFPDFLAKAALDGVGRENNLNWRYIWDALDQVIRFGARADELQFDMGEWSDGQLVKPIEVYL